MTREDQVEKIVDELEEEFVKANMPVNDKLTLFAKVSNAIYKYAEQEPCTDAISCDMALEKMADYVASGYADSAEDFEEYSRIIRQLPPVIPQHCEDVPDTNIGNMSEIPTGEEVEE